MQMGDARSSLVDEARILQTWMRLASAWDNGDASELASAFEPECDHRMLTASGTVCRGHDEVGRALTRAFQDRLDGASHRLSCRFASVRFLGADVAIVDGALHVSAGTGRDGRRTAAAIEPFTAVMRKSDGRWLISACRVGAVAPTPH